jgi:hypothetical protein
MTEEEKDDDPIGKALGLEPIENKVDSIVSNLIADAHNDSAKTDFEAARANIHNMIENGNDAMHKLALIAESSQHPRAFEVLAKLMDTMLNANEKLLDLQTKIRDINAADAPMNEKAKTINNNLFVGSTAELQKVLQDMKKNDGIS